MYARRLIQLTDEMGEPHRQVRAWRVLGGVFNDAGLIDSITSVAQEALRKGRACQDERCFTENLFATKLLRIPFRKKGNLRAIIQALEEFRDTPGLSRALHFEARRLIAFPLFELGDYDASLKELSLVWNYSKEVGDETLMCNLLGELVVVYRAIGDTEKALALSKQRLRICQSIENHWQERHSIEQIASSFSVLEQQDSAFFYFQMLRQKSEERGHANDYAHAVRGLLVTASAMKLEAADQYAREVLAMLENDVPMDEVNLRQGLYDALSSYSLSKNQYALAVQYGRKRLEIVRQFESDTSDLVVDAFYELAQLQSAMGDFESAWHSYDTFYNFKMAMMRRSRESTLAQTVVEMDLAENELARQKAEQATLLEQQASASQSRFFLFVLFIATLILGGVAWAYRRAQRDKLLITEKNQLVEQSLAEKEVLLREIHHRVKNNLQIISSLLDKQARKSSDSAVRKLVKEGQERIQSMALIHQNLYESEQLSGIDIRSYLQELSGNIQKSQAVSAEQIQLELNVEEEKLDIDTAIPVGLILNELLTNCYKYAFAKQGGGKIIVDFKKQDGQYFLKVSDDGIGFIPDQAAGKTKSLGLNLVNGLVRQLEGTIKWLSVEKGTAVAIRF